MISKFLILLITPVLLFCETPFILFTIPKSGSYLSKTLLEELTDKKGEFLYMPGPNFDQACRDAFDNGTFYFYHYREWNHLKNQELLFKKKKLFVNVRDPRDVCISSVYFFRKELNKILGEGATFDERLAYVIETPIVHSGLHDFFGPQIFYQNIFYLIDTLHPTVISYEELVGPKGGGSLETQIEVIQKVGNRLGTFLTAEEAAAVGDRIYGGTLTFRDGHIGSWKKHFTPEIIEKFKQSTLNQALIRLGYEQTLEW